MCGEWVKRASLTFLLLVTLASATSAGAQATQPTEFNAHQRAWLRAHPQIVLGTVALNWAPFEYLKDGQLKGLGIDYLQALAPILGVKVQIKMYQDLDALIAAACAGEVDVVMNVALTASRTRCMVFTNAYAEVPVALVGRRHDQRVLQDPDLRHLRLVTESGFPTGAVARLRYVEANHVVAPTTEKALEMVADGRADVYLGNPYVASAFMESHEAYALSLVRQSDVPLDSLHFAVPNARQPLAEALDVAMTRLPRAEQQAIRTQWLTPLDWGRQGRPLLSARETAALAQPMRTGFAPNAAPISFLDGAGSPSGLAEEYLARFRVLGATLNLVRVADWRDIRRKMRDGELDAVMGVPDDSAAAGEGWVFSRPFLTIANVIVTRRDGETVLEMRDLDGLRLVLSDRERLEPYVRVQAPHTHILESRSAEQGLEMVHAGAADAYIGNLAIVDRLIRERHSGKLQIAAPTRIEDRLALGVREQYAPLVSSFDRMLLAMPPREREAIRSDWLAVEYRSGLDWRRWLRWMAPLLLALGTAVVVHGIGHWRLRREVGERRRVERRLEEVTDNLPAVVYQFQQSAKGEMSFPFIVGDMMALFGIDGSQAMCSERELFGRIHPEDQPALRRMLERVARDFLPIDTQFRAAGTAGWRWVRSRATPYHADDGSIRWSGYWVDITQAQAQSQALADATATAQRATAAKADFLATMSHEIRTPMSAVLGMLEVLDAAGLTAPQREVLTVIEASASMLRQILDDILDFSRIEAGGLQLAPAPTDLRATVRNVHALLEPQALAKGLRFQCHIDADIADHLLVDGLRLRQVLFNLLSNAIKFTAHGSVNAIVALLGEQGGQQRLRISIVDTGIGISAEAQQRLFRPFSQAEAGTSQHYGGTGLGLAISRRLVEAMHGSVQLESAPGAGTTVTVDLDLVVAEPEAVPALPAGTRQATAHFVPGQRVLVVEDHPTNQVLMRWRLQQLGLEFVIAAEGGEALAALQAQPFDVVITDCRMPGMDGYAFSEALRERERIHGVARLPIIALTANASADERERCHQAGMDDVLTKPATLEQLCVALRRWLAVAVASDKSDPSTLASGGVAEKGWTDDLPTMEALHLRFGPTDIAARIAATLHEALRIDLDNLEAAMASGDANKAGDTLHRMAGGTGAVGTLVIAHHLRDLSEAVVRDGLPDQRTALEKVQQVMAAYRTVVGSLF
ncbi:transporter substrate-binding domain-containing protein [Stenotrophomonas sp. TWI700]|uniref:ATP-binding protein n=1 Tax=Stenotrophomonas sp. TWI700 TaxID=3136792 RepID=UPI00320AB3E4